MWRWRAMVGVDRSSDNGAAVELTTGMKNSYPLRGGYTTNWCAQPVATMSRDCEPTTAVTTLHADFRCTRYREGGVRAAGLVNGGLLQPGVRGTKLAGAGSYIHLCDFFATFCGLAGVDPTDDSARRLGLPPIDSLDMWPMLSGRNLTSPRHEILFTPLHGNHSTGGADPYDKRVPFDMQDPMIIVGEWKLLLGVVSHCWWQGPEVCTNCVVHAPAVTMRTLCLQADAHMLSCSIRMGPTRGT
jgi:hypothetical protein